MKHLGEYLSGLSIIGNPLGLQADGRRSKRLLFWMTISWIDVTQALVVALLPTKPRFESIFIYTGDIGFQHFAYRRHFLTMPCILLRINSAIIFSFFYFNNFDWFREANRIFQKLITIEETYFIEKIAKMSRIRMTMGVFLQVATKLMNMTYAAIYYRDRFEHYYVSIQLAYFVYFAIFHSMAVEYTLNTIYFYCRVTSKLFSQLNRRFRWMAAFSHRENWLQDQHDGFSQLCLLVHHFNHFIYIHYVVYFAFELPNVSNIFYNTFLDHNFSLYFRITFAAYLVHMLLGAVIMSHVIGEINYYARQMAENVYKHFVVHGQIAFLSERQRSMVVSLSSQAMSEDIGLVVIGHPINSITTIKVLSILLSLNSYFVMSFTF